MLANTGIHLFFRWFNASDMVIVPYVPYVNDYFLSLLSLFLLLLLNSPKIVVYIWHICQIPVFGHWITHFHKQDTHTSLAIQHFPYFQAVV